MTEPTPEPRSEEEVVAGILPVRVGKTTKGLRVLTMEESRVWKLSLVNVLGSGIGKMDLSSSADVAPLVDAAADKIVELVVSYDVDGTLGGREWLVRNATDAQVYAVLRRCLEVSFPFVRDLRGALAEIRALGLGDLLTRQTAEAESPPESSSNGPSTDGASTSPAVLLTSS